MISKKPFVKPIRTSNWYTFFLCPPSQFSVLSVVIVVVPERLTVNLHGDREAHVHSPRFVRQRQSSYRRDAVAATQYSMLFYTANIDDK